MDTGICSANNNNQPIGYQRQRGHNRAHVPGPAGKPSKRGRTQAPARGTTIRRSRTQIRLEVARPWCHPERSCIKGRFITRGPRSKNPPPLIKAAGQIHGNDMENSGSAIAARNREREKTPCYPTRLDMRISDRYARLKERAGWLIIATVISASIVDYSDEPSLYH